MRLELIAKSVNSNVWPQTVRRQGWSSQLQLCGPLIRKEKLEAAP